MKARPSRHSPRYLALIQLLRTAETVWNSSRVFFQRWGLSPTQFNVLNLLHGVPGGLSQIDLSRALLMHRSNLTGLVDRLEKRGLVARGERPGDRRSYRVRLTAQGAQLMRRIQPSYFRAAEEVWGELPDRRAHELRSVLERAFVRAQQMAAQLED